MSYDDYSAGKEGRPPPSGQANSSFQIGQQERQRNEAWAADAQRRRENIGRLVSGPGDSAAPATYGTSGTAGSGGISSFLAWSLLAVGSLIAAYALASFAAQRPDGLWIFTPGTPGGSRSFSFLFPLVMGPLLTASVWVPILLSWGDSVLGKWFLLLVGAFFAAYSLFLFGLTEPLGAWMFATTPEGEIEPTTMGILALGTVVLSPIWVPLGTVVRRLVR